MLVNGEQRHQRERRLIEVCDAETPQTLILHSNISALTSRHAKPRSGRFFTYWGLGAVIVSGTQLDPRRTDGRLNEMYPMRFGQAGLSTRHPFDQEQAAHRPFVRRNSA
jgi:hypothetical protein